VCGGGGHAVRRRLARHHSRMCSSQGILEGGSERCGELENVAGFVPLLLLLLLLRDSTSAHSCLLVLLSCCSVVLLCYCLQDKSASDDHERSILTRLKQQCGAQVRARVDGWLETDVYMCGPSVSSSYVGSICSCVCGRMQACVPGNYPQLCSSAAADCPILHASWQKNACVLLLHAINPVQRAAKPAVHACNAPPFFLPIFPHCLQFAFKMKGMVTDLTLSIVRGCHPNCRICTC
jgi:hypothetical protein